MICVLDDPNPTQKDDPDNLEAETEERSASPQLYNPASNKPRPAVFAPQIRLVECYACVDCYKVQQNTTTKYCPYTNDPTKNNKCVVYTEKYTRK